MVASLACARDWIEASPVLVSYTDIVYPADHVRRLMESGGDIALTYDTEWQSLWTRRFGDPLIDSESFKIDDRGILRDIGRAPRTLDDVEGQYMGLLKFTSEGWQTVCRHLDSVPAATMDRLDMTTLLRQLIEQGASIHAVPVAGNWGEVDESSDLDIYEKAITDGELTL
jgi:choline kinase